MRAAGVDGTASFYTWANESDPEQTIELPGVTDVIGTVIAKPALVNWAAKLTREGVLALANDPDRSDDWTRSDAELAKALKEVGYTPNQQRDKGGDRGTAAHEYFAKLLASPDPIEATNLYEAGVLDWVMSFRPEAAQLEAVLGHPHLDPWRYNETDTTYVLVRNGVPDPSVTIEVSSHHEPDGFSGSLDFEGAVRLPNGKRWEGICDLKTRKQGDRMVPREGEYLQLGAYWLARRRPELRTAILIVNGDGSYSWHEGNPERDAEAFLHVLETYKWMREER